MRKPDILAIAAEYNRRKKLLENLKPLKLDPNFPKQNAFIEDPSRFLAAQCSRRAGKTNGLAVKFFKTLEKYPGAQCLYLALTRDSAINILWPVLKEHNDEYKIGCEFVESKLVMNHPNGSKLRLLGADGKNFIKRLKGIKSPGVGVDEAQDFGGHLQSLIDDVLTPVISDYKDGWIALTGTPGPVPSGYFFEVTEHSKYGYSNHYWTAEDNPHMPDWRGFMEELKKKRGWDDNNPTLRREYKNQWVLDTESLWIRYTEKTNHYNVLPSLTHPSKYYYIMGVDIGYNDADAIAILAWSEESKTVYLVEEKITTKQGVTELANQIKELQKRYSVDKIVMDAGALGKKIAEELIRRHQIPIEAADKARKQENVEFLNDALRLGQFKAHKETQFVKDSYRIQIDWEKTTPDKIVIRKDIHSDIIDAVLYAYKASPAYTHQNAPQKPPYGSKAHRAQEQEDMFQAELEHLTALEEQTRRYNSNGWGE